MFIKGKQGHGTIRKGFAFHKELSCWRIRNGLEVISLDVGLFDSGKT